LGTWLLYGVLATSATGLMLGWRPRLMAGLHGLVFTAVELMEKAAYLNHYYFVSLICGLLAVLPSQGAKVPRWAYVALQIQVGLVYFHAGLAKLNPDWLFEAQPLRIWLAPFAHVPLVGGVLAHPVSAHVMSIVGAFFDLTIAFWLAWRRTRAVAWLAAVGFHVTVWLLFPIGVFSWVMITAATVFFDPGWPRRLPGLLGRGAQRWLAARAQDPALATPINGRKTILFWGLGAWLGLQALLPLRAALYPGDAAFTEAGFDFSWKVMLVEKTGYLELRVTAPTLRRPETVRPGAWLTPLQARMVSFRPDLILQFARYTAGRYRAAGHREVAVYADAFVSLNGRPAARLIDPRVDLSRVPRWIGPDAWIYPHPGAGAESR
jgi:hypothetical protein